MEDGVRLSGVPWFVRVGMGLEIVRVVHGVVGLIICVYGEPSADENWSDGLSCYYDGPEPE